MKTLIKNLVPVDSKVYKMIESVYHFRYWHPKEWSNDILVDYANYKTKVNFIQVGSNNGVTADPISRFIINRQWNGVLIEPVPYLFTELLENYKPYSDRLIFENSAIADVNGELKFYRLRKSDNKDLPYWYDQLGSFNKEVVEKHRDSIPGFDELFFEDKVNAITFNDLLQKHKIENVDFIQIDTEGYDYEILKLIPYSSMNVEFIMFENRHLSETDYRQAIRLLKSHGFIVGSYYKDTIAVSREILPYITKVPQRIHAKLSKKTEPNPLWI
jgi:FkbM family methyltransferase